MGFCLVLLPIFDPNLVGDEIGSIRITLRQSVSWSHFHYSVTNSTQGERTVVKDATANLPNS